jgi:hypothetical protein
MSLRFAYLAVLRMFCWLALLARSDRAVLAALARLLPGSQVRQLRLIISRAPCCAGMPTWSGGTGRIRCADAILGMVLAEGTVIAAADPQPLCRCVHGRDGQDRALMIQQSSS